jgi:hypothetical protein
VIDVLADTQHVLAFIAHNESHGSHVFSVRLQM